MDISPGALRARVSSVLSRTSLALLWSLFAYQHFIAFLNKEDYGLLLFFISETLAAAFFMFRTDPKTVSDIPFDWIVGVMGTLGPLFLRPASWGILQEAQYIILAGVTLQILGLLSLNRSFALVAAKREIKTAGMFRLVRHPLYASYFVITTGYVLSNTSLWNIVVYVLTLGLLVIRMLREESHLSQDSSYRSYMQTVRYRVIPFVF